jgi:hypothetical protein
VGVGVPNQERRGSQVSDKHLSWSVLKGRPLHIRISGSHIYGYLIGVDDYHYAVVPVVKSSDLMLDGVDESADHDEVVLLHKSRVDMLSIYQNRYLESESPEVQEKIQNYTGEYKKHLQRKKDSNRGANSK